MQIATCSAPTNIAVIKYWGKDNEALNTPLNSSVSVTLHQDDLQAKTTVAYDPQFTSTRLWLNGTETKLTKRMETVIQQMKQLTKQQEMASSDAHFHIVSRNSFPTAAGLASSAAGLACLVATMAQLMQITEEFNGQLSTIARQGSGSACRSMFGGFVRWEKGEHVDGSDSKAIQIASEAHWPTLCAIICVVNDKEKDTSSTNGMQQSKETSALLAFRAQHVVPKRLEAMEAAYLAKDFATFGQLTMQDSNQFHATCLDTYPPIFYLNHVSQRIIRLVHAFNAMKQQMQVAYTFDAGPNAVLFVEESHVNEVVSVLTSAFGELPITSSMNVDNKTSVSNEMRQTLGIQEKQEDGVKMLYVTKVGDGPRVLGVDDSLIDPATGMPWNNS